MWNDAGRLSLLAGKSASAETGCSDERGTSFRPRSRHRVFCVVEGALDLPAAFRYLESGLTANYAASEPGW